MDHTYTVIDHNYSSTDSPLNTAFISSPQVSPVATMNRTFSFHNSPVPILNRTFSPQASPVAAMNRTFSFHDSPVPVLNRTFSPKASPVAAMDRTFSFHESPVPILNRTFSPQTIPVAAMDRTFSYDSPIPVLNRTFSPQASPVAAMNRTFSLPASPVAAMNRTFSYDSPVPVLNRTFSPQASPVAAMNRTFSPQTSPVAVINRSYVASGTNDFSFNSDSFDDDIEVGFKYLATIPPYIDFDASLVDDVFEEGTYPMVLEFGEDPEYGNYRDLVLNQGFYPGFLPYGADTWDETQGDIRQGWRVSTPRSLHSPSLERRYTYVGPPLAQKPLGTYTRTPSSHRTLSGTDHTFSSGTTAPRSIYSSQGSPVAFIDRSFSPDSRYGSPYSLQGSPVAVLNRTFSPQASPDAFINRPFSPESQHGSQWIPWPVMDRTLSTTDDSFSFGSAVSYIDRLGSSWSERNSPMLLYDPDRLDTVFEEGTFPTVLELVRKPGYGCYRKRVLNQGYYPGFLPIGAQTWDETQGDIRRGWRMNTPPRLSFSSPESSPPYSGGVVIDGIRYQDHPACDTFESSPPYSGGVVIDGIRYQDHPACDPFEGSRPYSGIGTEAGLGRAVRLFGSPKRTEISPLHSGGVVIDGIRYQDHPACDPFEGSQPYSGVGTGTGLQRVVRLFGSPKRTESLNLNVEVSPRNITQSRDHTFPPPTNPHMEIILLKVHYGHIHSGDMMSLLALMMIYKLLEDLRYIRYGTPPARSQQREYPATL
ncbi:hypothetical protein CEXT_182221 [Caerostris extrusa]|uniref:Uncharacterized protein n=1 Tax=Caerostris extrusa TaxID=172846 RepID=A0AAV4N150_CAEEX|nr:hypothetical protein CEXT_182221 [Caerostris extrusa]